MIEHEYKCQSYLLKLHLLIKIFSLNYSFLFPVIKKELFILDI